jgi:hypothetical protein
MGSKVIVAPRPKGGQADSVDMRRVSQNFYNGVSTVSADAPTMLDVMHADDHSSGGVPRHLHETSSSGRPRHMERCHSIAARHRARTGRGN